MITTSRYPKAGRMINEPQEFQEFQDGHPMTTCMVEWRDGPILYYAKKNKESPTAKFTINYTWVPV